MPSPAFYEHTLPLIVTILVATGAAIWSLTGIHKRIDDLSSTIGKRIDELSGNLNKRMDEIIQRLDRIDGKLNSHGERITTLEAQSSPIRRT